jgi:hypothetical protein
MKHWFDVATLPIEFKKFIDNFLNIIDTVGFFYFFPDEQKIQPGITEGNKKKFDLSCFNEKLKLDDIEYIIRVGLAQTKYHVSIVDDEYEKPGHENYHTLKVVHNDLILKEKEALSPLQKELAKKSAIPEF